MAVYKLDAAMMEEEQVSRVNAKMVIEMIDQDNIGWARTRIIGHYEEGFI